MDAIIRLSLACMLTICLLGCRSDEDLSTVQSKQGVEHDSNTFYNIILLTDLSNRIAHPEQVARDKQVITTVLDLFEQRQRQFAFTTSRDKLTFAYQSGPNVVQDVNQVLQINMAGLNKPRFDEAKRELLHTIDQLYANARNTVGGEIDYWSFFRDRMPNYLESESSGYRYRNKCIVLSNGYFLPDNAKERPVGTCFKAEDLSSLRAKKDEWEQWLDAQHVQLLPHEDINFGNLEVSMMEVKPQKPELFLFESAILKRLWSDWFTQMGIDFTFQLAAPRAGTEKMIMDFLSKKSLWESMYMPIQLTGEHYSCRPLDHPEIVKDYQGQYFLINLKHAKSRKRLEFPSGKYFIDDFPKYEAALSEFGEEVIQTIEASSQKFNYQIFIKGQADLLGNDKFKAKLHPDYPFREVCFYPQYKSTYTFVPSTLCDRIEEPFTNADLPNLRAQFLSDKISSYFSELFSPMLVNGETKFMAANPKILDGNVTLKISEHDRNATLLLFLPDNFFTVKH